MKILANLLTAFLLLTAVSSAQTHPNFSGTWKLNVEKSDMGTSGVTALLVDVNHKDPALSYTVKGTAGGQDFEESESLTTDGKPSRDSHGATVKAHWEGATLVAEGSADDGTTVYVARITPSDDGKTFTRIFKQAADPQPRREIYEKQ
jgi:hypothetical protein